MPRCSAAQSRRARRRRAGGTRGPRGCPVRARRSGRAPRSAARTQGDGARHGEQRVADLAPGSPVVGVGDLVAEHAQRDAVTRGVADVLPVDPDAAAGRLADQEGQVEAGEQAGGEGVGARGHVDHDVLARAVEEVVEQQLDRADLGVVAGHAEVVLGRTRPVTRKRTPSAARGEPAQTGRPRQVAQPRSPPRRGGLDHRGGRGDARVVAAQVLLELGQVGAQRARRRGRPGRAPRRGAG